MYICTGEQLSERQYIEPTEKEINTITVTDTTTEEENYKRWKWLIDGWATMSFKERYSLFVPKVFYLNLRDENREDFDNYLNEKIVNISFENCRSVAHIKFDPDGQGVPNILVELGIINPEAIPSCEVKEDIEKFYESLFGDYLPILL